jgi:LPXTG-motif cell wall-anchored protein
VTAPAPTPSATTTTGPGFLPEESTTPPASAAPTGGTSGGALPATGGPSMWLGILGALTLAVGFALVGRNQRWTLVPAGSGRHRARH